MNIGDGFRGLQQVFGNAALDPAAEKTGKTKAAGQEGSQPAGDVAHLSSAATLATNLNQVSDVRLDKIASIRQAIESGTYNVSNTDVAESLMNQILR